LEVNARPRSIAVRHLGRAAAAERRVDGLSNDVDELAEPEHLYALGRVSSVDLEPPGAADPLAAILGPLNAAQHRAVEAGDRPLLVIAGAGTGKTQTLVHRVAALVARAPTRGASCC
jgi:hypothetical protein